MHKILAALLLLQVTLLSIVFATVNALSVSFAVGDTLSIDTDEGAANIYENPQLLGIFPTTRTEDTSAEHPQSSQEEGSVVTCPDVIPNFPPPPIPQSDNGEFNFIDVARSVCLKENR